MLTKSSSEKLRFVVVGSANTLIDFGILFLLTYLDVYIIVANYISTSVALVFSFFANKHFTFRSAGTNAKREFISFLLVTLFGLWVLQPVVMWLIIWGASSFTIQPLAVQVVAKLAATVVSMIWNYVVYKRVVFQIKNDSN